MNTEESMHIHYSVTLKTKYDIHMQYSITSLSSKTIHIQYSIHLGLAIFSIQFSIQQTKIQGIQYAIQYAVT